MQNPPPPGSPPPPDPPPGAAGGLGGQWLPPAMIAETFVPPPKPPRRRRSLAWVIPIGVLVLIVGMVVIVVSQAPEVQQVKALPASRPAEFLYLNIKPVDEQPFRWNPCEPIHYVTDLSLAPDGGLGLIQEAVARTSEATGIEFVYDGDSTASPSDRASEAVLVEEGPDGWRWAPVVLGWVDADEFARLPTAGQGEPVAIAGPIGNSGMYVTGWAAFDAAAPLRSDWSLTGWGPVIQHEFGHIIGLDHATSRAQLMYPNGGDRVDWGQGDLAGLRALGRSSGCLETPDAPSGG